MSQVLTDLVDAFETYPREYLDVKIVEVDPPGGSSAINVGEEVTFRLRVTNSGPLEVTELELLVEGLNETMVRDQGAAAQFVTSFTHANQAFEVVPAHSGDAPIVSTGSPFTFKPTHRWQTPHDLVRASVHAWQGSLGHIERSHSREDALAEDTYTDEVLPA